MEWGPWIEHDGNGIKPFGIGFYVKVEWGTPDGHVKGSFEGLSSHPYGRRKGWHWEKDYPRFHAVIRYRIRKPLGLTMLETILNELPAPTKETVYHE